MSRHWEATHFSLQHRIWESCLTWHRKLQSHCGEIYQTYAAWSDEDSMNVSQLTDTDCNRWIWGSEGNIPDHKRSVVVSVKKRKQLGTAHPIKWLVGVLLWNWFAARVCRPWGVSFGIPKMFLAPCQHKYGERAGERERGQGPWEAMQVTLPQRNLRGLWWASLEDGWKK